MLINQTHVREHALAVAGQLKFRFEGGIKKPRFTRVSASFLEAIEGEVRKAVVTRVNQHGNSGQTLA
jgi:hypothetical protein